MSERTEHGFRSGAIDVQALAEWRGGSAVCIQAGTTRFEVQATPKGQNVLIVMPEGADGRLSIVLPDGDRATVHWTKRWGGGAYVHRNGRYLGSMDFSEPVTNDHRVVTP